MMAWGMLLLAALVMKLWPETPCGRWLQLMLIDRPVALISGIRRRHLIFLIIGFAVMYNFAEMGMPHLAFAAAIDVSAYVDAMITVWTVAALTRTRGSWTALRGLVGNPIRGNATRPRQRRTRLRARGKSSNDDDGHGVLALAA